MKKNCADSIREIRSKLLLTQQEFADVLGVSFATVNRWENGWCTPTIKTQRKIRDLSVKEGLEWKGFDQ